MYILLLILNILNNIYSLILRVLQKNCNRIRYFSPPKACFSYNVTDVTSVPKGAYYVTPCYTVTDVTNVTD